MQRLLKNITNIILLILISTFVYGCKNEITNNLINFTNLHEISTITDEEINQINTLRNKYADGFIFAIPASTELYENVDGELHGFVVEFCSWMSTLFDIPVMPKIEEFSTLETSLKNGDIHFAGGLAITPERLKIYTQSKPIVAREIKYFHLNTTNPIELLQSNSLNLGLLRNSATTNLVLQLLPLTEIASITYVSNNNEAIDLLLSGKIDAYVHQNTTEYTFINYPEIVASQFSPITFIDVGAACLIGELSVIINVINKTIQLGQLQHFTNLYNQEQKEFNIYKFLYNLTFEELIYFKSIEYFEVGLDSQNYPMSFYNAKEKKWQGVLIDVFNSIKEIFGIEYLIHPINLSNTYENISWLNRSDERIIGNIIKNDVTVSSATFINNSFIANNRLVLVSKNTAALLSINEIQYQKIALISSLELTPIFFHWFPYYENYIYYDDLKSALTGAKNNEVNLIFCSEHDLIKINNLYEDSSYIGNIYFNFYLQKGIAVSKDNIKLNKILSSMLTSVDMQAHYNTWRYRTFDYQLLFLQMMLPYLIIIAVLIIALFLFACIFLIKKHKYNVDILNLQNSIIKQSADFIYFRDNITGIHIKKVQMYLPILVESCMKLNIYSRELKNWDKNIINLSAQLHDIGKISISDTILNKPGKLTEEEYAVMKNHPLIGQKIIEEITQNSKNKHFFDLAINFCLFHHERYDGSGYPNKLKGLTIPLEGRMMAIIDVYEALTSERPYKTSLSPNDAYDLIVSESGKHFDPNIVRAFKYCFHKLKTITNPAEKWL